MIRERSDQVARRRANGSRGGRSRAFDPITHRGRSVVERAFARLSSGESPLDSTSTQSTTGVGSPWPQSSRSACDETQPEHH